MMIFIKKFTKGKLSFNPQTSSKKLKDLKWIYYFTIKSFKIKISGAKFINYKFN
jgi:hypothetical protein